MKSKSKESNYEKFVMHVKEWDETGIPYGRSDLVNLAKLYDTPIPDQFGNIN
jgi:hypothetical protein